MAEEANLFDLVAWESSRRSMPLAAVLEAALTAIAADQISVALPGGASLDAPLPHVGKLWRSLIAEGATAVERDPSFFARWFKAISVNVRDFNRWLDGAMPPEPTKPTPSGIRTIQASQAEAACEAWIGQLKDRPKNKDTAFADAKAAIDKGGWLSRKAFERAWANAAPIEWKRAGTRKKSPP
jgi:hypothetical protein